MASWELKMEQGQLDQGQQHDACPSSFPPQTTRPDLSSPQLTQDNDPTIDCYCSNLLLTKTSSEVQTIDDIFGDGPTSAPSWSPSAPSWSPSAPSWFLSASEAKKTSAVNRYTGALIGLVTILFITIPFFVLKYIVGLNI